LQDDSGLYRRDECNGRKEGGRETKEEKKEGRKGRKRRTANKTGSLPFHPCPLRLPRAAPSRGIERTGNCFGRKGTQQDTQTTPSAASAVGPLCATSSSNRRMEGLPLRTRTRPSRSSSQTSQWHRCSGNIRVRYNCLSAMSSARVQVSTIEITFKWNWSLFPSTTANNPLPDSPDSCLLDTAVIERHFICSMTVACSTSASATSSPLASVDDPQERDLATV